MANFNLVLLIGNLTRDVELSYTPSNTSVAHFGLAVNRKWTGQDKQPHEEVCFVDCVAFSKLAENLNKYVKKGQPLLISGRLIFEAWQGKDGTKHSKHKVVVESFQFLDSAKKESVDENKSSKPIPNRQPADDVFNTPVEDDEKPVL